jgi:hypothetical protein
MRNLLSREEYIEQLNEGFIKDTIKKGVQKVKSAFNFFVKKIKNMILIFDKNGKILPVVTPQSTMNMVADIKSVKMYAPQDVIDRTVELGGVGCETTAPLKEDDEIYNYGPDGKEFAEWIESGEYKNDIEYQNFMSIPKIINEFYENLGDEDKKLFETMMNENVEYDELIKNRVSYTKDDKISKLGKINTEQFQKYIRLLITDWSKNRGRNKKVSGKEYGPMRNLLVLGAPGIGKSTIPNTVIEEWNNNRKSPSNKISLITVNCANIQPGDLMMPTVPIEKKIPKDIDNINKEIYPVSFEVLSKMSKMSDAERKKMEAELENNKQWVSDVAPKIWLPAYRPTGDKEIDAMLDEFANKGNSTNVTGGGIILFDELLRAHKYVFNELLNFLLNRELFNYRLGSRWAIIACSNRPVDDGAVQEVFKEWSKMPAAKDRWGKMLLLEPDPEGWKKWIRKKGCDELILKFIFEEGSMIGDEYPRWHSVVVQNSKVQTAPITPRKWEEAIGLINRTEIDQRESFDGEVPDISQLDTEDIKFALQGTFDEYFIDEFTDWLNENKSKVNIDEIFYDPINTPLPKAMLKEKENNMVDGTSCLDNIWKQLVNEFEENPEDLTDENLTNLFIWLGRNFKDSYNLVFDKIINNLDSILDYNTDNSLFDHKNACIVHEAAWPPEDLIDGVVENGEQKQSDIEYFIEHKFFDNNLEVYKLEFEKLDFDGMNEDEKKEEVLNKVLKKIIKEYFPWNLNKKTKEIKLYSELETD